MLWNRNNALGWRLRLGSTKWFESLISDSPLSVSPAPSSCRPMEPSVPTEPLSWSLTRHSSCWSSTWDNTSWGRGPVAAATLSQTPQTCLEEEVEEVERGEVAVVPVSLTGRLSIKFNFNPPSRVNPEYTLDCLILKALAGTFCPPPRILLKIRIAIATRRDKGTEMSR